ncbi:uncharacterized protein LOC112528978 [Cynara cardunculus var. scolymus]|uniref:Zinc finger, CW-type n=1 Tax=Cynara cardunculus var. scolymus TaxID=59895 RepID=A0A103XJ19_CYNCS|nr:uncharacterized protein LOC112528978 [Cynara cardunculus var. scolymus]KVH91484.1 Zinc finger, CW-type [Cynara cardunculus var. scolymus]
MEETELEEGEACFDDIDESIDPDIALSYIDKRLQDVLGHFQKDFEGGISAELLGPKFGGYGSFLPTHKQSPAVHSHTKTPQRILNFNKPRSPDNFRLEGVPLNSVTHREPILPVRPAAAADDFASKDTSSLLVSIGATCLSKNETIASNVVNPTEQRSLKVRIKVGSDKSARKNIAIYSGLGLLSPSFSTGNNPEDSGGQPTESHDITPNSPGSILREMTSFLVPGNRLLSPLNESLLCLTRRGRVLENRLTPPIMDRKISSTFVDDSSSVLGEGKLMEGKEVSSRDKSEVVEKMKYKNSTGFKGDKAPFLEKGVGAESLDSKQYLTNDFKVKLSSNSVRCSGGMLTAAVTTSEANRAAKKDILVKKREIQKEWMKEQLFGPDFTSKESEAVCGQDCGSYEQKDVKHSSIEHTEETKARSSTKKLSLDSRGTDRIKGSTVRSVCKNDTDVSKHEPDRFEKKVASEATTREPHEVKVPRGINKLPFEKKTKLMGIRSSGISPSRLVKENLRSGPSGAMKDKKTAQKDIVKVRNSYKDVLDTRVKEQNDQTKALEMPTDNGANRWELGEVKGKHVPINEFSAEAAVPLPIEVAPAAPPDNWVGCDRCEKWRLLPIGIEPENLPDKWLCSMSTWLPGRNHCDISEDETTKAVQEMNLHLISQKRDSLQYNGSGVISGVVPVNVGNSGQTNLNINADTNPDSWKKNKFRPEDSNSSLRQTSHSSMDAQQHKQKRKSSSEANQSLLEKNVVNKPIDLHPRKLSNFAVGRHAAKVNGKDVTGGDLKPKKLKSKTGSDQYHYLTSNKFKTEAAPNTDGYRNNKPVRDLGGNGFSSNPTLPSMADERDMEQDDEQLYTSNGDHQCRDRLIISVKRQKESTQVSMKSKLSDRRSSEKVEMHAKKRKLKDWQESQPYGNTLESTEDNLPDTKTREESSDRTGRKEKRLKTSKTEVKESAASKGDDRSFHKGKTMKIILPASKENSVEKSHEKNHQQDKHREDREKATSRPNLRELYSSRKDLESERFLLAATSSSSKVSDSCRRASLQERKGSPVESVSSSPMRALNLDKLSPAVGRNISRKGHAKIGGTGTEIPRKLMAREDDMKVHRSVQGLRDTDGSQRFGGKVEPKHKEASKIRNTHMIMYDTDAVMEQATGQSDLQAVDNCWSDGRMSTKDDATGALIPQSSGKASSSRSKENDRRCSFQRVRVKVSDSFTEQEPYPNKMRRVEVDAAHCEPASNPEVIGDGRRIYLNESSAKVSNDGKSVGNKISRRRTVDTIGDEKPSLIEHAGSEAKLGDVGSSGMKPVKRDMRKVFVGDLSRKRDLNEEEQTAEASPCSVAKIGESALVRHLSSRSLETTALDVQSFGDSGHNVSKVLKHTGDTANQKVRSLVTDSGTMKDLGVISFVKEYISSQTAMTAFKRAEESKDYADRIKISGFDYECKDAYFDSALKFLYAASLLEACSTDLSKSKGVDPVNVYSTSAKLCKTCAQEFEKQKELASVALAYKCMEVAYMRIVYCKSLLTRQDLQTSLQMVTHGESPSSSASDVDNLNNQATMDKTMLSKSIAHTGNHVVARNQANFLRLLDLTGDVSLAMEASTNTQKAYATASASLEEAQNKEMMISVKRVVDFSFQDIKEVVCLVQHAREAINRQGFRGRD